MDQICSGPQTLVIRKAFHLGIFQRNVETPDLQFIQLFLNASSSRSPFSDTSIRTTPFSLRERVMHQRMTHTNAAIANTTSKTSRTVKRITSTIDNTRI